MAQVEMAAGPFGVAGHAISSLTRLATRHIRATVLVSIVLICGSFAAAVTLQLQMGRERALKQAAALETQRAQEIAAGMAERLNRAAAIASSFAAGQLDDNGQRAVLAARTGALRNLTVVDETGHAIRTLKEPEVHVRSSLLSQAFARRVSERQGSTLLLAFAQSENITVAELDLATVFPESILSRMAMTDADGHLLAAGNAWTDASLPEDLRNADGATVSGQRIVAVAAVPGWPLRIAAAMDSDGVVGAWYGSLPLYLFVILGPAIAGAWLAVIFVREFERRARAQDALAKLRNTSSHDAKLLVRLAEAEKRASESERAKSEFVAHVSHELRTPLNAIIGFSEIISHSFFGQPGHPKYIEYARDISAAGRELHGKIGDILEYANLEAGRHPISLSPTDLVQIATDCVNEMIGRAFSRRIDLGIMPQTGAYAMADQGAVKRILSNLVSNAINFTPDGGKVTVEIAEAGPNITVRVTDTGCGFSEEEAARVGEAFATFERLGSVTGLGLGLAVATTLAERMGGGLVLAKNKGAGTIAELRLRKA